jgi:hypothetical protein
MEYLQGRDLDLEPENIMIVRWLFPKLAFPVLARFAGSSRRDCRPPPPPPRVVGF